MKPHSWLKKLRQWVVLPKLNKRHVSFFAEVRGRGGPLSLMLFYLTILFSSGLSRYNKRVLQ